MSLRAHFGKQFWIVIRILILSTMVWFFSSWAAAQQVSYDPHKFMIARSHYAKAMKLLADNKLSEGEAELLEAVKTFPQLAEGYVELGNLSMRRGEFREGGFRLRVALLELAALLFQVHRLGFWGISGSPRLAWR